MSVRDDYRTIEITVTPQLRDALSNVPTFGARLADAMQRALRRWAEESDALSDLHRALTDPQRLDANDWEGYGQSVAQEFLELVGMR